MCMIGKRKHKKQKTYMITSSFLSDTSFQASFACVRLALCVVCGVVRATACTSGGPAKSLFEPSGLSRCIKVRNYATYFANRELRETPFKYFFLLIHRDRCVWGVELSQILLMWAVFKVCDESASILCFGFLATSPVGS